MKGLCGEQAQSDSTHAFPLSPHGQLSAFLDLPSLLSPNPLQLNGQSTGVLQENHLEWPEFLQDIKRFHDQLQKRSYQGFTCQWRLIEGERHAGTKAESYNRGVRFAFAPLVKAATK